jgi:hypothetical protein
MPAKAKGARLWLRVEKGRPATWFIKDGDKRIGTGLAADERSKTEQRLGEYLAAKHEPARDRDLSPSSIPVTDVLAVYVADRASTVASPKELGQRVIALASFFGEQDAFRCQRRPLPFLRGSEGVASDGAPRA